MGIRIYLRNRSRYAIVAGSGGASIQRVICRKEKCKAGLLVSHPGFTFMCLQCCEQLTAR